MINQQSSNKYNNSQQQIYYTSYPPNSFITGLFCSSVQPKVQNLFDQPNIHSQKLENQPDVNNDSWDDLAYKNYQSNTSGEQNDTQFFNIFAPCNQQNQSNNNSCYQQQQFPVIFAPFDNTTTTFQPHSKQKNCKQITSPYTPQKNHQQQNQFKSSKKWNSGSIHSTPQTAPCSSMKEESLSNSTFSNLNQHDVTEFNYNVIDTNTKQKHNQTKINCGFSASFSSKSSNCNSDSEESCFLSTNTHISSASQSNKQTRKVLIKNFIDDMWNKPYDGFFNKLNFPTY